MVRFRDRSDAGRRLASVLRQDFGSDVLVLGLARGGVPVAYELARVLRASLDVLVVRKLGVPGQEELAMGAIGPGGARVLNPAVLKRLRVPDRVLEEVSAREQKEIERRERAYRQGLPPPPPVRGRTALVADDGLATGASMRAAVASVRASGARRVVVAVPTGSPDACEKIGRDVDALVCICAPEGFFAVGQFYEQFAATTDEEVRGLLMRAAKERGAWPASAHG